MLRIVIKFYWISLPIIQLAISEQLIAKALLRRHMSVKPSYITDNSTVFQQIVQVDNKENTKPCITGPSQGKSTSNVDSAHKGTVTRNAFPCHDVIMYRHISLGCHVDDVYPWAVNI